jgi:iron complex outermembrane receptor protein
MHGAAYGVEIWGEYRMTPWWRLSASFDELSEHLKFTPSSSGLLGIAQAGDDPEHQASLRSSMNLGQTVTFDNDLRYVGELPDPRVPAYMELDSRVGWNLSDRLRLSLSGFNLLHERHQEFPEPLADPVQRSFLAGLQWRF